MCLRALGNNRYRFPCAGGFKEILHPLSGPSGSPPSISSPAARTSGSRALQSIAKRTCHAASGACPPVSPRRAPPPPRVHRQETLWQMALRVRGLSDTMFEGTVLSRERFGPQGRFGNLGLSPEERGGMGGLLASSE